MATIAEMRSRIEQNFGISDAELDQYSRALSQSATSQDPNRLDSIAPGANESLPDVLVENIEARSFGDYQPDGRLADRLIERHLDDALLYLRRCLALRKEYSDLARLYIDNRLKAEEFLLLDAIHTKEINAGLYELPWREAVVERDSSQAALDEATSQIKIYTDLTTNDGALTPQRTSDFITNTELMAWGAIPGNPNEYNQQHSVPISQYKIDLDVASWKHTNSTALQNEATLKGKVKAAVEKATYLWQDIAFRTARTNVSRFLSYAQISEDSRDGSITNYRQRMAAVRELFDESLAALVARVLALESAVPAFYGLQSNLIAPEKGKLLDTLAAWLSDLQERLSIFQRVQRTCMYAVWLSELVPDLPSELSAPGGANFRFDKAMTGGNEGLLRGLAFEYVTDAEQQRPIVITADVPGIKGNLVYGRVSPTLNGGDFKPQYSETVWNIRPYDNWAVSASSKQVQKNSVKDVVLYVWIAHL